MITVTDGRSMIEMPIARATVRLGDLITMDSTPRLSWWGRLLVRVGLRPPPKSVLRRYRVTHLTGFNRR